MSQIKTMGWIIIALAVSYILIGLLVYLFQKQLVFYPSSVIITTPSDSGIRYEEVQFKTTDNVELNGWYIPHQSARATVIFFHGNAGNISGRMETIKMLHNLHLNIFIFDYRGFGKSSGTPTESGTYLDASAAWNYVINKKGTKPSGIVLMGRSLGGAIAAKLAMETDPAGVIIESSFTSAADIAEEVYGWLPVRLLIKYEYDTREYVKSISKPILIAHSREDDLIPFDHGRELYDAANQPKYFLEMRGPHAGGFLETGELYTSKLDRFITESLITTTREKQ